MGRIAGVSPAQTRERLIDAAAEVFESKGYEGATVAEIASKAGLTTGAIYAHYTGKAELLVDAIREHGERATAAIFDSGSVSGSRTILEVLAGRLLLRGDADSKLLMEAVLASRRDPDLNTVVADALSDNVEFMRTLLIAGQDSGELADDVDAAAAAHFMLMVGLGSMLIGNLDLPEVDEAGWTAFMGRMIGAFTPESSQPGTTKQGATK